MKNIKSVYLMLIVAMVSFASLEAKKYAASKTTPTQEELGEELEIAAFEEIPGDAY